MTSLNLSLHGFAIPFKSKIYPLDFTHITIGAVKDDTLNIVLSQELMYTIQGAQNLEMFFSVLEKDVSIQLFGVGIDFRAAEFVSAIWWCGVQRAEGVDICFYEELFIACGVIFIKFNPAWPVTCNGIRVVCRDKSSRRGFTFLQS